MVAQPHPLIDRGLNGHRMVTYSDIFETLYMGVIGSRSRGPCTDFPFRRPPVLQHETPQKFISEFAKVTYFGLGYFF